MDLTVTFYRLVRNSFSGYSQTLHPTVEMTSVDTHALGGFSDAAVVFGEFMLDELSLICVGRVLERGKSKTYGGYSVLGAERRQIVAVDLLLAAHYHNALDSVLQFANIPGPAIVLQAFDRITAK